MEGDKKSMKEQIIDQFFDECEVTPGPWGIGKDGQSVITKSNDNIHCGKGNECDCVQWYGGHVICESVAKKDRPVITASRQSLKDWILTAWELEEYSNDVSWGMIHNTFTRAVKNIESSLSMPWVDVRKRLEEIEE